MNRPLIPLFICLTILGCTDMGIEPEPAREPVESYGQPVPGVIMVHFTDGTTLEQAEQLIKDLGLSFKVPPTGTPLNGVVPVPIGTEDEWVAKLITYPIVKSASRVWLVHFVA